MSERERVIEVLTTHRHGEKREPCKWCANFYGAIYDRIEAVLDW